MNASRALRQFVLSLVFSPRLLLLRLPKASAASPAPSPMRPALCCRGDRDVDQRTGHRRRKSRSVHRRARRVSIPAARSRHLQRQGRLQGFRPFTQAGITVNSDQTSRADARLEIGTMEEGIVVSGEAPLLDTSSALKQTVLTQEVLESLPNRMDVWSITRVIPSIVVSKVDVGGSESFLQSGVTVRGTDNEGGYYIDGMDVSSLDGEGDGATMYLDPYAFAESNFLAGNNPAESPRGGLVFNMVTKTGTNQLHGGGMFSGANRGMGFDNFSDSLRNDLLATAATGRPRHQAGHQAGR